MIDREVLREIVLKEGIAKGRAIGEIEAYYDLINKGILTKDQAASMMNMSVVEFDKKCIELLELA